MKNLLVVLLLVPTIVFAASSTDKRIKKLEKKVRSLQKQLNADVDELHERADANELAGALSKVKFGLDTTTSYHYINGHVTESGKTRKIDTKNKLTTIFNLNMNAHINAKTNFTGRLAVTKNWADFSTDTPPYDFRSGRSAEGGNTLFLDRAYIDYYINRSIVITLGRQPGSDGPGTTLRNNTVRQATYPVMLFDASGDGIVLTTKPTNNSAVRFGYAKMYQYDAGVVEDALYVEDSENAQDGHVYFIVSEVSLPKKTFGDNTLIFGLLHNTGLTLRQNMGALGVLNMNLGDLSYANLHFENTHAFGSNFSYFVSATYLTKTNAVDNSKTINKLVDDAKDKILIQAYTAVVDGAEKKYRDAVTAGVTAMVTADAAIPAANKPAAIAAGVKAQLAKGMDLNSSLMTLAKSKTDKIVAKSKADIKKATEFKEEDAHAVFVGFRYDFSESFKLGYQFFYGSEHWYAFNAKSVNDPLGFTRTRGTAHDIYGIYQIDMNQFLRLSATRAEYKYSDMGMPVGKPAKLTDDNILSHYMLTYSLKF